jgi:hypothetical protein
MNVGRTRSTELCSFRKRRANAAAIFPSLPVKFFCARLGAFLGEDDRSREKSEIPNHRNLMLSKSV